MAQQSTEKGIADGLLESFVCIIQIGGPTTDHIKMVRTWVDKIYKVLRFINRLNHRIRHHCILHLPASFSPWIFDLPVNEGKGSELITIKSAYLSRSPWVPNLVLSDSLMSKMKKKNQIRNYFQAKNTLHYNTKHNIFTKVNHDISSVTYLLVSHPLREQL